MKKLKIIIAILFLAPHFTFAQLVTFTSKQLAPTPVSGYVLQTTGTSSRWVSASTISAASTTWGTIIGTLSNQTDLQAALDAKLSTTSANILYVPYSYASSTFASTSYVTATYVPYTGATTDVNLGTKDLLFRNSTSTGIVTTGQGLFGNTGGVYLNSAGSGVGGLGFNSTPDGGYLAGVTGYGALMQLAPSTGVFTMFAEGTATAGNPHSHTTTLTWDSSGNLTIPKLFATTLTATTSHLVFGNIASNILATDADGLVISTSSATLTVGTSTVAINVAITDDGSTIATYYPTFATAVNTALPLKTDGSFLRYNPSIHQLTFSRSSSTVSTVGSLFVTSTTTTDGLKISSLASSVLGVDA